MIAAGFGVSLSNELYVLLRGYGVITWHPSLYNNSYYSYPTYFAYQQTLRTHKHTHTHTHIHTLISLILGSVVIHAPP